MNSYTSHDEKIDVAKIRIYPSSVHGAAVLGEFRAADRLLIHWADGGMERVEIDFEVTFQDGYAYRGRYEYRRRSRGRPSLSKFVRRAFSGKGPAGCLLPASPERYLIEAF